MTGRWNKPPGHRFDRKTIFQSWDFNIKVKMRILCWKDSVLILKRLHPTWSCTWSYILTMRLDDAKHYIDVTVSAMAFQITGISTVCSSVGSGVYKRKRQNPASFAFVRGIHRESSRIPLTKGELRGICFHLMTSSCRVSFSSSVSVPLPLQAVSSMEKWNCTNVSRILLHEVQFMMTRCFE